MPLADPDHFASCVQAYLHCAPRALADVPNLVTRVDGVGEGERRLPVTVNDGESPHSWVCSPHTAYVRYAVEELHRFGHPLFTPALSLLCRGAGHLLQRGGIDRAVGLNHWALSTNLYPPLQPRWLDQGIDECAQRWPRAAIWLRSLNAAQHGDWLAAAQARGCLLVPSRQVYWYPRIDTAAMPVNLRRDLRLLARCTLARDSAAQWQDEDFAHAAQLYAQLYLQKYSRLNPAYGAQWLRAWWQSGLLDLRGLRDAKGRLIAVVGLFRIGDTLTAPIVGYDTALPRQLGLYRLLMAMVYDEVARQGWRLNLSAGAAQFKRLRGGEPQLEYSAVSIDHLPRRRQRAVRALAALATRIGAPLMRRYAL